MKILMIGMVLLISACGSSVTPQYLNGSLAYEGTWTDSNNGAIWVIGGGKIKSTACEMKGSYETPDLSGMSVYLITESNGSYGCPSVHDYLCVITFDLNKQNQMQLKCYAPSLTTYNFTR